MTKHLRTVKVSLILGILLISAIPFLATNNKTTGVARNTLVNFQSIIDVKYDVTPLNQPLQIDVALSIPVDISLRTTIPEKLVTKPIGFPIGYFIVFGSPVGPTLKVHLEILNAPDWADIYFGTSDVILEEIPYQNGPPANKTINLIISPRVEAPATPQHISIRASIESMKRLKEFSIDVDIPFTPSFIPTIAITPQNPIRTVGPHESVSYQIVVKNLGNKITRITPTIIGADSEWTPIINPPLYEIQPNSENIFTFSMITPYNFGWHNEYGRFQIDFKAEVYPYRSDSPTSSQSIYLIANNHGFSIPGFEFIALLAAILIITLIIKKKQTRT